MDLKITHNQDQSRFETIVDGSVAYIEYISHDGNILEIIHTMVPSNIEGRGIATSLSKWVLGYIRSNQLKVRPTCPYTASYIEHHLEYKDLISPADLTQEEDAE